MSTRLHFLSLITALLSFSLIGRSQSPGQLKEVTTNATTHFANNIDFSKDGNYFVVVVGFNADVYQRKESGFQLLQTIAGGKWQAYNPGISDDGSFICFSNYEDTYVYKRNGDRYSLFQTINHAGASTNKDLVMHFTGNDKLMIIGGAGNIRFYTLGENSFSEVKRVTNPDSLVFQYAALSANGQQMATIDVNGDVHCWQILDENAQRGNALLRTNKYTGMVDITDDLMLAAGETDSMNLYKVNTDRNTMSKFFAFEKDKFGKVVFNPDGNRIMVANQSGHLSVYKIAGNLVSLESVNKRARDNFTSLQMSDDAKWIAASSSGGKTISFFEAPERIIPVKQSTAKKTTPNTKATPAKPGTQKATTATPTKAPAPAAKSTATAPKGPAVYIIPGKNNSTGKYVLIDSLTMKQYGTEEYQETGRTKNNLVYMYKDWHYGLIKKTGEMIVNPDTSKYIRIEDELDSAGNYVAILLDVKAKNKFGGYLLLNKQYKPITSRSYGFISDYENGYYLTHKYFPASNDKSYYGLVNKTGKEVLKPEYKLIRMYPKEKLIKTFTHDDKEGLYDYAGKQLLPDEYDNIDEMDITEKRLIVMKKGERAGLIDRAGKIVVPLKYNNIFYMDYGKDSYYEVKLNGKIGTLNMAGKEVIPPQYTSLFPYFEEGCAFFSASKDEINSGWIDKTGKVLLPLIYKEGGVSCPGKEGLGRATISDSSYVYVNKLGQQVFGKKFRDASGFNNGLAYVQEKDKYGFINNKGVYVVQPEYENISQVWETDIEMYAVRKGGKWGFMDNSAKMVVPPTYDDPDGESYGYTNISEGLIAVKQNGKWGFIDKKGNVMIPFLYDSASGFRDGKAEVELNGQVIKIDKKGGKVK